MAKTAPFATAAAAAAALLGGPASAAPPPPPSTADYVEAAAASDQFEILEGRVAAVEGRSPRVRAFAQQMIQEHSATTQALGQAARRSGLPPPPMALSGDQAMMLGTLQSLSGPEFDKTYLRQQVLGHRSALVAAQSYAAAGADADIRRTAQSTAPIIQRHLDMATQLQAASGEAP